MADLILNLEKLRSLETRRTILSESGNVLGLERIEGDVSEWVGIDYAGNLSFRDSFVLIAIIQGWIVGKGWDFCWDKNQSGHHFFISVLEGKGTLPRKYFASGTKPEESAVSIILTAYLRAVDGEIHLNSNEVLNTVGEKL